MFILLEDLVSFLERVCICFSDSHGLGELYEEWYAKKDMERDFIRVKYSLPIQQEFHISNISLINAKLINACKIVEPYSPRNCISLPKKCSCQKNK